MSNEKARALVGMTQGAKKRAALYQSLYSEDTSHIKLTNKQLRMVWRSVWPLSNWARGEREKLRALYRIGQRLRPCPGCEQCTDSPRLQVMGWVRRIGGRAKLTRIYSRWYQRAEYLLMIYRPGPTWNPAASGGVTKPEAWKNMRDCLSKHDQLKLRCDGSGVIYARKMRSN